MDTMERFLSVYKNLEDTTANLTEACKALRAEEDFVIDSISQAQKLIEETKKTIASFDAENNREELEKAREDLATYQALYEDYLNDLYKIVIRKEEAIDSKKEFMRTVTNYYYLKNSLNENSPVVWFAKIKQLRTQIRKKFAEMTDGKDKVLIDDDSLPLDMEEFKKSAYVGEVFVENEKLEKDYRVYLKDFYQARKDNYKTKLLQELNQELIMHVVNNGYADEPTSEVEEENEYTGMFKKVEDDEDIFTPLILDEPKEEPLMVPNPSNEESEVPFVEDEKKEEPVVVYETAPAIEDSVEEEHPLINTNETVERQRRERLFNAYYLRLEGAVLATEALRKGLGAKIANGEAVTREEIDNYNHERELKEKYEAELRRLNEVRSYISDTNYDLHIPDKYLSDSEVEYFVTTGSIEERKPFEFAALSDAFGAPKEEVVEEKRNVKSFRLIRKASEKTKNFIKEHKKVLLVAAFVAVAATSFLGGRKSVSNSLNNVEVESTNIDSSNYMNIDEPIITITSEKDEPVSTSELESKPVASVIETVNNNPDILNSVKDTLVNDVNNKEVRIGDSFTLKSDAQLYSSEYLDGEGMHPYYAPSVERTISMVGVTAVSSDGSEYVKMCTTNDEINDLISKGGHIVSVYSPLEGSEGFYNVDSIEVMQHEAGRSI